MSESVEIPEILKGLLGIRRPHGGEGERLARILVLETVFQAGYVPTVDNHGNVQVLVGDRPDLVFTSHLDTVHRQDGEQVLWLFEDTMEIVADGKDGKPSVLGADDASGVYLLTEMIKAGKPGRYLFFVGEECGGVGSSAFVKDNPDFSALMVVSFDRRGTKDIITHQSGYCTASTTFALALADALNRQKSGVFEYLPCDGGLYTDSKEFAELVPECTNVAVGYYCEHTTKEIQDLGHLLDLRDAVIGVDWTALPIARVPEPDNDWFTGWPSSKIINPPWEDEPSGKTPRADIIKLIKDFRERAWNEGINDFDELDAFLRRLEDMV